jgi:hypothetical protein
MMNEVVKNTGKSSFGEAQPIGTAGELRTIDAKQWPSRGTGCVILASVNLDVCRSRLATASENLTAR